MSHALKKIRQFSPELQKLLKATAHSTSMYVEETMRELQKTKLGEELNQTCPYDLVITMILLSASAFAQRHKHHDVFAHNCALLGAQAIESAYDVDSDHRVPDEEPQETKH